MISNTLHQSSAAVIEDTFYALGSALHGDLLRPGDIDFDVARKVQDITVDRFPLAIVRAANADDVAAGVAFARDHALPLAVRSGGHSVAGHSMVDGALVIDLAGMKAIIIDPETRLARVGAGVTSGDLAGQAAAYGLALSTGDTASVGMGGLATGGGIGFMVRKYGLTIDSLVAVQVVTAAGEIVTASDDEHPDLFWAIRGGGGNFGIVTEFTFRLASVGQVLGGALALPASRAVLRGYLEFAAAAPDDLTMIANLMYAPPAPFIPQERVGELVLMILVCWTGSVEEGERVLAPLRALVTPVADAVWPMPYPALYQFTAQQSVPQAVAIRAMFTDDLSDAALDATLEAMARGMSPFNVVQLRCLGGAMARVADDTTAFAHRERRYFVSIIAAWMDTAEDASVHQTWVSALWRMIRDEGCGTYVNFLQNEGTNRVHDAYPTATYARLAAVKRHYDPQNLFRLNQNIVPTAN